MVRDYCNRVYDKVKRQKTRIKYNRRAIYIKDAASEED